MRSKETVSVAVVVAAAVAAAVASTAATNDRAGIDMRERNGGSFHSMLHFLRRVRMGGRGG